MEETLISILVFVTIVLFSLGGYLYLGYRNEQKNLSRRVSEIGEETHEEGATGGFRKPQRYLVRIFWSLGGLLKPKNEEELSRLRKNFLKAGYRSENAPVIFLGIKLFLAILFPVLFPLTRLWTVRTFTSLEFMFAPVLFALIGFYLPDLWLYLKIKHRQEKILEGFPDVLDLMVVCVEAGNSLEAAINRVGEEMKLNNKVLSEEFKLLSLELRAGKARQSALKNLALRTGLEDINNFAAMLIQTERFGTNIAQALRVHSDSMRTKRSQRAEEIAAKLPVKLASCLIIFILPSLFVTLLGPMVIRIFRELLPILKGG